MSLHIGSAATAGSTPWTTGSETPVGTINSVNKSFTVSNTPKYVVSDGVTYFPNAGYTYSAPTITMDIAPTWTIASAY